MNERPILFSGPMVRAILEGRKAQTRRVVKPQPRWEEDPCLCCDGVWRGRYRDFVDDGRDWDVFVDEIGPCPFGQPGDLLWVREKHSFREDGDRIEEMRPVWYWADGNPEFGNWSRPCPSIHMPKPAARIWLWVTGVRVERLQSITPADARAEGHPSRGLGQEIDDDAACDWFADTWDAIYAKRGHGWDANPWVWVVSFAREIT